MCENINDILVINFVSLIILKAGQGWLVAKQVFYSEISHGSAILGCKDWKGNAF